MRSQSSLCVVTSCSSAWRRRLKNTSKRRSSSMTREVFRPRSAIYTQIHTVYVFFVKSWFPFLSWGSQIFKSVLISTSFSFLIWCWTKLWTWIHVTINRFLLAQKPYVTKGSAFIGMCFSLKCYLPWTGRPRGLRSARVSHLLPDVVMREETTQFTLGERSTMIRVFVPRQHLNPHRLYIRLVQSSEGKRRNEQRD